MRLSIFEALRIPATASETEIRTAFRRLIRRLYASARDSSGDLEEGLRFCNAASSIVLIASDRNHYEGEYANLLSGGQDLRRSHAAEIEIESRGGLSDMPAELPSSASGTTSVRPGLVSLLEICGGAPSTWRMGWLMLAALGALALVALFISHGASGAALIRHGILLCALAATVAAIGVALHRWLGVRRVQDSGARLRDVAVVKWRRERSVFMGSRMKNEEAAWVYRLRVAETDRARQSRTSRVPMSLRILARLVDYSLWGGFIYLVIALFVTLTSGRYLAYLTSWWLLPVVTVITWIPVEAWCLHRFRRTPGKWLVGLRCRPGMTALGSPDSTRESPRYALQRAAGVAGFGLAGGLPLLNLIAPLLTARVRSIEHETRWDALGDSVVTRIPMSSLQAGLVGAIVATAAALFFIIWLPSLNQTVAIAKEARQLASQVTWAQLFRANPTAWIPQELLDPAQWNAKERVAKIGEQVVGAAEEVASGVAAVVTGAPGNQAANPEEVAKQKSRFAYYAEQANRAMQADNAGAAFALCERWVREEPNSAVAWKCYGLGLQMKGRHAEALQALRRSQRLDPSDQSLHNAIRLSFSQLNERPPNR